MRNNVKGKWKMNKDTLTKEEVIEMLREMQIKTAKTQGFIVGQVSQLWVIRTLLGTKIEELGGESIEVNLIN